MFSENATRAGYQVSITRKINSPAHGRNLYTEPGVK
jgi:hypothetical protein